MLSSKLLSSEGDSLLLFYKAPQITAAQSVLIRVFQFVLCVKPSSADWAPAVRALASAAVDYSDSYGLLGAKETRWEALKLCPLSFKVFSFKSSSVKNKQIEMSYSLCILCCCPEEKLNVCITFHPSPSVSFISLSSPDSIGLFFCFIQPVSVRLVCCSFTVRVFLAALMMFAGISIWTKVVKRLNNNNNNSNTATVAGDWLNREKRVEEIKENRVELLRKSNYTKKEIKKERKRRVVV